VGKTYNQLDERLHGWIAAQHIFFVATAPQRRGGHVNLSPKGHADTFAVLDERTVTYLDLTGRGAETAAQLRDDGRITLMFCAFSGLPRILRLYGQGRIVLPSEERWDELAACSRPAAAPVTLLWSRSSASRTPAAYAVPLHDYARDRGPIRPVGSAQGRGRHGRLPCPAQQQEHRRPSRSPHARQ
jgi:hypothetical protein